MRYDNGSIGRRAGLALEARMVATRDRFEEFDIPTWLTPAYCNVNDDDVMWAQVSWEDIIDRDPDLFAMADLTREVEGKSMADKIDFITFGPAISQMPAAQDEAWMAMRGMEIDPAANTVNGIVKLADHLVAMFGAEGGDAR